MREKRQARVRLVLKHPYYDRMRRIHQMDLAVIRKNGKIVLGCHFNRNEKALTYAHNWCFEYMP